MRLTSLRVKFFFANRFSLQQWPYSTVTYFSAWHVFGNYVWLGISSTSRSPTQVCPGSFGTHVIGKKTFYPDDLLVPFSELFFSGMFPTSNQSPPRFGASSIPKVNMTIDYYERNTQTLISPVSRSVIIWFPLRFGLQKTSSWGRERKGKKTCKVCSEEEGAILIVGKAGNTRITVRMKQLQWLLLMPFWKKKSGSLPLMHMFLIPALSLKMGKYHAI